MMREMKIHLAPQEPTSSFLRSGANIGKKLQEEEDVDVQGGQGGRRNQEKRLMGAEGVAHNRDKRMAGRSLILQSLIQPPPVFSLFLILLSPSSTTNFVV